MEFSNLLRKISVITFLAAFFAITFLSFNSSDVEVATLALAEETKCPEGTTACGPTLCCNNNSQTCEEHYGESSEDDEFECKQITVTCTREQKRNCAGTGEKCPDGQSCSCFKRDDGKIGTKCVEGEGSGSKLSSIISGVTSRVTSRITSSVPIVSDIISEVKEEYKESGDN